MQKSLFIFLSVILVLTAGSCKKKKGAVVDLGDYQPITTGSEWNYTVTGTGSGTYKITSTGRDTSVNGKTYKVMTNSAGPNEYYNKTGNDYFRFAKLAEFNNQSVELLYLNDNLAVNQTWVETKTINVNVTGFGNVPVTAVFTFTVAAKGISHTVNGVVFKDVIKITAVPVFSAFGSVILNTSDLQYFYARKAGLINSKTILSIPLASVNANSETTLTSYTIK